MADRINQLVRLRGAIKGSLTRLMQGLETFIDEATPSDIEGRRVTIQGCIKKKIDAYNEELYTMYETEEQLTSEMVSNYLLRL